MPRVALSLCLDVAVPLCLFVSVSLWLCASVSVSVSSLLCSLSFSAFSRTEIFRPAPSSEHIDTLTVRIDTHLVSSATHWQTLIFRRGCWLNTFPFDTRQRVRRREIEKGRQRQGRETDTERPETERTETETQRDRERFQNVYLG